MRVVILGSGYVGLVTGVGLAEKGHHVICVDSNSDKINLINSGTPSIYEEGLEPLLKKNVGNGRLSATVCLRDAMVGAEISMIAVGTPFDGNEIDLSQIKQAAKDISECLDVAAKFHVVCVKSTVIPGTTQGCVGPILEQYSNRKLGTETLGLCMNPEFLAEGTAIADFMNPDRIIIGAINERSARVLLNLYEKFDSRILVTNPSTAEMTKYAANAFLATVISYANEIANLCEKIADVDVVDVLAGVKLDKRLSPILPTGRVEPGLLSFLYPGPGFGGSCFPKDVKAMYTFSRDSGAPIQMLDAVIKINSEQPKKIVAILRRKLKVLEGKTIGILGLAFKPGTDDVRESPSISLINLLLKEGSHIIAHDPIAIESMKKSGMLGSEVQYESEMQPLVNRVDALVVMTSWPEYAQIHTYNLSGIKAVIDARRYLDKTKIPQYGGIGLLN